MYNYIYRSIITCEKSPKMFEFLAEKVKKTSHNVRYAKYKNQNISQVQFSGTDQVCKQPTKQGIPRQAISGYSRSFVKPQKEARR